MASIEQMLLALKEKSFLSRSPRVIDAVRPAYDALLRMIYGRRGIERRMGNEPPIRLNPRYRSISEDCEREVVKAMKSLIRPGDTALDIGANIGVFTLLLARWVGPSGAVHAFEPAPESLNALRYHAGLNELSDRVTIVAEAVSDQVGMAAFYAHSRSGENSLNPFMMDRMAAAEKIEVPLTTIDAYCSQTNITPSFLKFDIEGFEFHALEGGMQTLRRARPRMLIEFHAHLWAEVGVTPERIAGVMNELKEIGYSVHPIEGQSDLIREGGHGVLRCDAGTPGASA